MSSTQHPLDLQGHRGARGLRPESTLVGFEVALDLGVTTLEMDLHLSRDGELVVWHDPYISGDKCRVAPGADGAPPDPGALAPQDPQLLVSDLTVAELQGYVCDQNPDPARFPLQTRQPSELAGSDFGLKRFTEVLDFVATYAASTAKTEAQRQAARVVRFNVETKRVPDHPEYIGDGFDGVAPGDFERALFRVVTTYGIARRFTLQSFDHRSLWAAHTLDPTLSLAALTSDPPQADHLARWASRGASIWSPNHETLTPENMAAARAAGLRVIPWTVNNAEAMRRALALGVDGLISDRPDLMIDVARADR